MVSSFQAVIRSTERFLRSKGVKPVIDIRPPARARDIATFKAKTGVQMPETFAQFYLGFSDGLRFNWSFKSTGSELEIPSIQQLTQDRLKWAQGVKRFLDDPHSLDRCVKAKHRAAAFAVWEKMLAWIPIHKEGNGDGFCVDATTEAVVYDRHDWFDGFGGSDLVESLIALRPEMADKLRRSIIRDNGALAARDLHSFLSSWARFNFQMPQKMWWENLVADGAIQWSPEFFDAEFIQRET